MSDGALVSIIVPIYNVEAYLDDCVKSLLNQTYETIEIILVDDGSPDNCPTMCDVWKEKDNRIKVIHKKNGGVSDSRNSGMRIASGNWLLFIDSDDMIGKHFVEYLVSAAQGDGTLAVSDVIRFQNCIPEFPEEKVINNCTKNLSDVRGGMYACGILYERKLVESIGLLFDTNLRNLEDVTWNAIYLRYISKVVHVNVPYFYRINPTSITSKCSDYKWQVASWIAARQSIMNWFADKSLTRKQLREVKGMFRHCQNNIHAECVAGKVSYGDLREMEREQSVCFNQGFVSAFERFVMNHFPQMYYGIYTLMLRVKKAIRR